MLQKRARVTAAPDIKSNAAGCAPGRALRTQTSSKREPWQGRQAGVRRASYLTVQAPYCRCARVRGHRARRDQSSPALAGRTAGDTTACQPGLARLG